MLGSTGLSLRSASADLPLPDPHIFRVPARSLPWYTDRLLSAQVESNSSADGDGLIIYNWTRSHDPTWNALRRMTGWYESALMWHGKMNPSVDILVSEYASEADAERGFAAENHNESYRQPRRHLQLGSQSVEYASSKTIWLLGSRSRVEDSIIYTRIDNLEVDVAVYDAHAPRYRWDEQYREVALVLAKRVVAIAVRAVSGPGATPTAPLSPTPTVTATSAAGEPT
ncbi:MAG: hypothetical protein JOZ41_05345 [Chloroflexi bacterium]|nr:hypothetical protein [Chloroflexota bacterium]